MVKKRKAPRRFSPLERKSNRRAEDAGDSFQLAMRAAKNDHDLDAAERHAVEGLDLLREARALRDRQTKIEET